LDVRSKEPFHQSRKMCRMKGMFTLIGHSLNGGGRVLVGSAVFKTVSRALVPFWVGSIPMHLRHKKMCAVSERPMKMSPLGMSPFEKGSPPPNLHPPELLEISAPAGRRSGLCFENV
jgi:hypothetical protein